jgi:hypothetical protein
MHKCAQQSDNWKGPYTTQGTGCSLALGAHREPQFKRQTESLEYLGNLHFAALSLLNDGDDAPDEPLVPIG